MQKQILKISKVWKIVSYEKDFPIVGSPVFISDWVTLFEWWLSFAVTMWQVCVETRGKKIR